jgi:hypothetical protein
MFHFSKLVTFDFSAIVVILSLFSMGYWNNPETNASGVGTSFILKN